MKWNWQLPEWPHFIYDSSSLPAFEKSFFQGVGGMFAILRHLDEKKRKQFIVEILCTEGLKSAEIEGELLERESLQSSIRHNFGLDRDNKRIPPEEQGMADLMCRVYDTYDQPLTHEMLYEWHDLLIPPSSKIADKGIYRTHDDPMVIVSGRSDNKKIYFEAPPSADVHKEMTRFIDWFNNSRQEKSVLGRAGLVHVYFESIHPFEDGNGRIGRALVEKVLSQSFEQPTLIAISQTITRRKKEYYAALGACNCTLDIRNWTTFFAEVILQAQEDSLRLVNFLMSKSELMNSLSGKINARQEKALLRMFSEGLEGFSGGLSAKNYITITKTSKATATRDLNDLVEKGALRKTGMLRQTRYWLNIVA